ncbi:aldehyde dehydrogenase [Erwinia endophytica]|uniref:molybdopterin cofactor-binding domain-containing protein n=1 Tax=Erwinia endophytica TaxID=1563158 RepID=UPI001265FA06|nr:molybdopterin cofactor-binding domain-containing protein [Erwinia endophytica]KAB8307934.1 aldehyde dehydrogenase [Erwinia endophytica]
MNHSAIPTQQQLLNADNVLLIVDEVQPPPGLVPKGQTPALKPKELALFLAIDGSGQVWAFNGHVDLGTGVKTALTQIVAEELNLRLDQVQMVLGDTLRVPNQGATIASATLQISAVPLRKAAAEARRWLTQQAATRLQVAANDLRLDAGEFRLANGACLSFAELVNGQRCQIPLSDEVPLKPTSDYRLVGTSSPRVDIPAKATGELTWVHDLRLPGMLHGRVIRPPYAGYDSGPFVGTSLLSIDERSIAHLDGIVKVVQIADFVGVVAEREDQAIAAMEALQVHWKPWQHLLPDMRDVEKAIRDNPRTSRVVHDTGAVDAALDNLAQRFTRHYVWPYQLHASIGPSCAVADYHTTNLQVWSGTQNPHLLRADLAWLLEMPENAIEVNRMEAAGCYGRNCADDVAADAALLSRAVGQPVRVQLTRAQEHVWEPKGTAQLMDVDGGLDAAGNPQVYDFTTAYPSNGAPTLALLLTQRVEPLAQAYEMGDRTSIPPYDFPHLRVTIEDMAPLVRASWMRGVSALPNTFAHESYMDELAHAAGVDPVEYRLRYIKDPRAVELIRSTAGRAGWTPRTEPMQQNSEPGVLRGRGFAYARYIHSKFPGFGAAWAAWVADVAIDKQSGEIAVTRITVGHDAGLMVNPDGVKHQIHGNVIQSTSRVLKEQVTIESNIIASQEWGSYPILTFPEVPDIDVMMVPRPDDPPLGAGESASVPSAAAIANAVFDATGIRFRELPITSEKLRQALNGPDPRPEAPLPPPARKKNRRRKWAFGGAAGLLGAAIGIATNALPWRAAIAPVTPLPASSWSVEMLEHGRQIAAAGDCAVCHTRAGGATNAGGLKMDTPFGTLFSSNITPDKNTGIGNWSFNAFDRAMRQGISRDGHHLYPAFPYTAFRQLSESDMQALYAWLMSQPAVEQAPIANEMRFPFNMRFLMAGWNALYLRSGEYQYNPGKSAEWNRGAYLVNAAGHCGACHSPRNRLGAEQGGDQFLAGGWVDGWEAPALNQLSKAPQPWTAASLYHYLRTGYDDNHGVAAGPMAPVVSHLATLPEADVRAMASYLADMNQPAEGMESVVPSPAKPAWNTAAGERLFNGACLACHSARDGGPQLFGVSPSMANSSSLTSATPDNLLQVVLHGIDQPATDELGYMPGFAASLSDQQVADIAAYLRQRYAPDQPAWTDLTEKVAQVRAHPSNH